MVGVFPPDTCRRSAGGDLRVLDRFLEDVRIEVAERGREQHRRPVEVDHALHRLLDGRGLGDHLLLADLDAGELGDDRGAFRVGLVVSEIGLRADQMKPMVKGAGAASARMSARRAPPKAPMAPGKNGNREGASPHASARTNCEIDSWIAYRPPHVSRFFRRPELFVTSPPTGPTAVTDDGLGSAFSVPMSTKPAAETFASLDLGALGTQVRRRNAAGARFWPRSSVMDARVDERGEDSVWIAAADRAQLLAEAKELERRRAGRGVAAAVTASPSPSRTTSTSPGCRRPQPARLRSRAQGGRARGRSPRSPPARSAWGRPTSISSPPVSSACARRTGCRKTRSTCAHSGRVELRLGGGGQRRAGQFRAGYRHRRLGSHSRGLQRPRRSRADARSAPRERGAFPPVGPRLRVGLALTVEDAARVAELVRGYGARDHDSLRARHRMLVAWDHRLRALPRNPHAPPG